MILFQRSGSDDEDETFYESYQTPTHRPTTRKIHPHQIKTPDSLMSPYPESEYSRSSSPSSETPTRTKDPGFTLDELQEAAKKLNLCLVNQEPEVNEVSSPPVVPPRQKTEISEAPKGNVNDDENHHLYEPCMHSTTQPEPSNDVLVSDNIESPTNESNCDDLSVDNDNNLDEPSTSDESEECETVILDLSKNPVQFCKTEMRFRDIYDEVDQIQFQEIASGPEAENNDSKRKILKSNESVVTDTDKEQIPTKIIEESLKEAIEETSEVKRQTLKDAPAEKGQSHLNIKTTESSELKEEINSSITQSTESLKTDLGKPKSVKKVRAPPPPGSSQTSLVSPSESIIHLTPATVDKQEPTEENESSTDNSIIPVKDASKKDQEESSEGKVLYRSRGYDVDAQAKVRPTEVNIKESRLEDHMIRMEKDSIISNTFMKNQEFLQPLVQGSYRHSGTFQSDDEAELVKEQYSEYLPIRESSYSTTSPTRLFTYNPSTGISRLRKYDNPEEPCSSNPSYERPSSPVTSSSRYYRERPSSPLLTESYRDRPSSPLMTSNRPSSPLLISERGRLTSPLLTSDRPTSPLSTEDDQTGAISRCPHCTIHTWLPHSPGCINRRK